MSTAPLSTGNGESATDGGKATDGEGDAVDGGDGGEKAAAGEGEGDEDGGGVAAAGLGLGLEWLGGCDRGEGAGVLATGDSDGDGAPEDDCAKARLISNAEMRSEKILETAIDVALESFGKEDIEREREKKVKVKI